MRVGEPSRGAHFCIGRVAEAGAKTLGLVTLIVTESILDGFDWSARPGAGQPAHDERVTADPSVSHWLGRESRKNCHESHERGKPTAIFSKRRKIDTL